MQIPKAREMRKLARRYMEDNEPLLDKQREYFVMASLLEVYALVAFFIPVISGYIKLGGSGGGWLGIFFLFCSFGIWVLIFCTWLYLIDDKEIAKFNLIDYYFEKVHKEQP